MNILTIEELNAQVNKLVAAFVDSQSTIDDAVEDYEKFRAWAWLNSGGFKQALEEETAARLTSYKIMHHYIKRNMPGCKVPTYSGIQTTINALSRFVKTYKNRQERDN